MNGCVKAGIIYKRHTHKACMLAWQPGPATLLTASMRRMHAAGAAAEHRAQEGQLGPQA